MKKLQESPQKVEFALKGELVTFGIIPDSPKTCYGYIESFDELSINNSSSKIKKFIEKPNLELALNFIKIGITYGIVEYLCSKLR